MDIRRVAALAAVLLLHPLAASAQDADAARLAKTYFTRACADQVEHVAVHAPGATSFEDITTGATGRTSSWDRYRFEQFCALPKLYVYHCHTTHDVLTRFPSGSTGSMPGDFGNAAEMEFSCAKAGVIGHYPPATLVHGLVTPQGEVITYGLTEPTLATVRAQGRAFGEALAADAPKGELARAQAQAQRFFADLNARHYDSFIRFALKTCPDGDIEHCEDLTVENFAAALPPDDWRFIRVGATPAREAVAMDTPVDAPSPSSTHAAPAAGNPPGTTELTPATLGSFVADGKAMVSICAEAADGLLPCAESKMRMSRLAASCPRLRMGFLDQDKYPDARYLYPVAKDRSLLLFKTNPDSGTNEQFELTTMGEPTPQLIAMVLCDETPFGIPAVVR